MDEITRCDMERGGKALEVLQVYQEIFFLWGLKAYKDLGGY